VKASLVRFLIDLAAFAALTVIVVLTFSALGD
jgi:hypothetical protein